MSAGATQCGQGYLAGSYACAACAPGYSRSGPGGCDACPAAPAVTSGWARYAVAGGIFVGVAVAALLVGALVLAVTWCKGDSLSGRTLRAVDLCLWALLTAQVRGRWTWLPVGGEMR